MRVTHHGLWVVLLALAGAQTGAAEAPSPATFSIVAADPEAGEVGVAVASRFFAVGAVVPTCRAGVGAVATQAYANTTFGPRGLELLERGLTPEETLQVLLRSDAQSARRQVGLVSAKGASATHSGAACNAWAGGRHGADYAVQGNILAGDQVVAALEQAFLSEPTQSLAERLYAALRAGDDAGGDSRGKQSAAILVCRDGAGYGGYTDQAVDIRVDDHAEPMVEIGRLLALALVNDDWNRGWTAFTQERHDEALRWQERAAERAAAQPAILPEVLYDLAVIRLANQDPEGALASLRRAIELNPKLREQARGDQDLEELRDQIP